MRAFKRIHSHPPLYGCPESGLRICVILGWAVLLLFIAIPSGSSSIAEPLAGWRIPAASPASGAIQYVTAQGDDSNDGTWWPTAKRTIYRALEALPGGAIDPPSAGRGVVWVTDGVSYGGPERNGGMWLMGSVDKNFAHPPRGWLRYTGGIRVQCGASGNSAANGHVPLCRINAGGNSDDQHPSVWLSSIANGFYLDGLAFQYPRIGMRIGIDSSGNRQEGGAQNIELKNVGINLGNCAVGGGPGVDIGNNTFWIWIVDSSIGGCSNSSYGIARPTGLTRSRNVLTVTTATPMANLKTGDVVSIYNPKDTSFEGSCLITALPDSRHLSCWQSGPDGSSGGGWVLTDQDAAVNINPGGKGGSGLLVFRNDVFGTGGPGEGIRFQNGLNGGSIDVQSQTCEGSYTAASGPCVHVYWNPKTTAVADVNVWHVESADNNNGGNSTAPAIQVDGPFDPSTIVVSNVFAGGTTNVRGPMTVLGQYAPALDRARESPLREGQIGFFHSRIVGTTDAARRLFSPVAVRYANLATASPKSWILNTSSGGAVIRDGIPAPDGTPGAATASEQGGYQNTLTYFKAKEPVASGDYFIAGVWVRAPKGYSEGLQNFRLWVGNGECQTSGYTQSAPYTGDGEWEWLFSIQKVLATSARAANVAIGSFFDKDHPITAYAPVLIHITAPSVSDNEAYELAYNLSTYSSSCVVGNVCGLPSQVLQMPGAVESQFLLANQGSEFTNAYVALSPAWGKEALVSGARGSSQRFVFTVVPRGPGIGSRPTLTIRFPTRWPVIPIFTCKQIGGTGGPSVIWGEDTATQLDMRLEFGGMPSAGSTYVFACQGE